MFQTGSHGDLKNDSVSPNNFNFSLLEVFSFKREKWQMRYTYVANILLEPTRCNDCQIRAE